VLNFLFLEEGVFMSRVLGMFFCLTIVMFATGCSINGINGLLNGSGIDLSTLDLNALISELTSGSSTS